MTDEAGGDLLIRAEAVQDGVVGDPMAHGAEAARLVVEARRRGETEALVVALRALAWTERARLANRSARELLDEAAALCRRAGLATRLGEVLITRSAVEQELGRPQAALADLAEARMLAAPAAVPDLEHKLATVLHNTGRLVEAAAGYVRVLEHPSSTPATASAAANNLGLIESLRGRSDLALRYLDRAAALAPAVGPARIAFVAHNRGLVLAQAGRLGESLRQLDHAAKLLEAAGLPLGEFHFEHADALVDLRLLPEARGLARRAARDLAARDVPLMAAEARLRVAQAALLDGDLAEAVRSAATARALFRRHRRTAWAARATVVLVEAGRLSGSPDPALLRSAAHAASVLGRLGVQAGGVDAALAAGRLALVLGRRRVALRWWREAHARARRGPLLVRLKGEVAAALVARERADDRALLRHCRRGLDDLARHRAAVGSVELRALAAGHGIELGLLGLEVLLRIGAPSRLLDWVERTRAAASLTVEAPAPDAVRDERAALAAVQAELAAARREGTAQTAALVERQAVLEDVIRRATWQRSGAGRPAGTALRTPRIAELLAGRALVSFGRSSDGVFAVVLARGRRRLVRLGAVSAVRAEADAVQFALRRLTRAGPEPALAAARASLLHSLDRLRAQLIAPLGLDPEEPVVVVPARDTHRLPWTALHRGPVAVAPSASLWAATRTRRAPDVEHVVVVAGPGLAGAEQEADAVAARYPRPTVLAPPKSTPDAVLDAAEGASLLHLACHGHLRADNPLFSALQVTDGLLTVHELDLRGIAPHRVVLAACDAGADVSYDGDELVGFVTALLARGTAGLAASVVAVGDVEAVGLMSALHGGLAAGMPVAQALHAARPRDVPEDPRELVNWCAFTAYGAG
jgi:tetratricopeptide (TPR) repeat protein/CBS domain-containing protein